MRKNRKFNKNENVNDKNYIIKRLPELLKDDEEFRSRIISILLEFFPSRVETLAILEEIRKLREEGNKRFKEMQEEIKKLREDTNKRFEEMDARFRAVWEEIKKLREDTNKRFEEMRKEVKKVEKIDRMERKLDALGARWGLIAEGTFREGIRSIISGLGFTVIKWRKRDEKGEVFLKPRDVEIDIVVRDRMKIAVEIKSSLSTGDVDIFEKSSKFYEKIEGVKLDRKVIIAVYTIEEVKEYAKSLEIDVISEPEELV